MPISSFTIVECSRADFTQGKIARPLEMKKLNIRLCGFVASIDYRCDNKRFWLSAHDRQVPTPTSQKPRSRTANSDFWSRLSHQLLGRLKSTIPYLQIYLPKEANSEELGLGIDNPCRTFFFWVCRWTSAWRGLINDRHFWNPGVFSHAMLPTCRSNSRGFYFIFFFKSSHI
jgi:hypothetical protein